MRIIYYRGVISGNLFYGVLVFTCLGIGYSLKLNHTVCRCHGFYFVAAFFKNKLKSISRLIIQILSSGKLYTCGSRHVLIRKACNRSLQRLYHSVLTALGNKYPAVRCLFIYTICSTGRHLIEVHGHIMLKLKLVYTVTKIGKPLDGLPLCIKSYRSVRTVYTLRDDTHIVIGMTICIFPILKLISKF